MDTFPLPLVIFILIFLPVKQKFTDLQNYITYSKMLDSEIKYLGFGKFGPGKKKR